MFLICFRALAAFSLGLERAGMTTVGFCEIDPFCRAVLAKHWPKVPCHDDIATREFTAGEADVVCGGFPCQDISNAGKRAGIAGSRSGLWRELVRAIRVVRPKYAIVENVAAIATDGMGTVLGDLAESGFDSEWSCLSACALGAPHTRERMFVLAYPDQSGRRASGARAVEAASANSVIAGGQLTPAANRIAHWSNEPRISRVANGIPFVVDRSKALGNSVVPQIPELIGRAIMEAERKDA
jgi:DNA (cytosine-5)-methyltransferase 1